MNNKRSTRKRGNKLGFWFFEISLRIFGLKGAYGLLYFVCLYYLVFDRKAVTSSLAYINRRYKDRNIFQRIYYVYILFVNQGKNLIDRFYVFSGQGEFEIELQGFDKIKNLLDDQNKGIVLLTAHVGNWQVTMTALEKLKKDIYLLMRPEDNMAVKEALDIDGEKRKIKVISPDRFLGGIIELTNALNNGNIVSIMGDRTYEFDWVEVPFLGEKAYFPFGAFSLGASVKCPVVVLLSAKVSTNKYLVSFSEVIEPCYRSKRKKRQDIKDWVGEFARILENYVASHPLQWFVFYDLWENKA